jgi:hypothetical protein
MRQTAFGILLLSIIIAAPALADSDDHRDRDGSPVRLGGVGNQIGDRDRDRDKGVKQSERHGAAGAGAVGASDVVGGPGSQSA